ncbi:MAG: hypothetical protein CL823_07160 [Crocinitomicaceae bacterium]|nr:hypothetical protein [Crocinitomicaceae bacterium]|tara:strand:+ start:3242 stop:3799 length:558 start_codon:yes stop_codon:yes gene_type:complete
MSSKSIGKRITISEHADAITIVISQKISFAQQIALEMWFGAWIGLGGLIGYGVYNFVDERYVYLICMTFWGFFFVRIGKVIAWRRIGNEVIRINKNEMLLKNAFKKRGKDRFYRLSELGNFQAVKKNIKSFMGSLDNSFWIIGGDTIHFKYKGKTHVLGKQLPESDSKQLATYLNKSVQRFSKKK